MGVERQGLLLSLSHIADGEWRCVFMSDNARLAAIDRNEARRFMADFRRGELG